MAHLLAFGLLVFVVVLVSLSVLQIVGLGEYGGFVAGVLAALAAMFGGTICACMTAGATAMWWTAGSGGRAGAAARSAVAS